VFLSSTWADLQAERSAVETALNRMRDALFAGMEYFGSRPGTPLDESLTAVDESDLYVGIFGARYGSGITEAEYRQARSRGIPCLIFLKREADAGAEQGQADAGPSQLLRLKRELQREHVVDFFDGPQDLSARVVTAVHNVLLDMRPLPPSALGRHNLPAEPSEFVGRSTEVAHVHELLRTSRLVTLTGIGGAGKTRLAVRVATEALDGYPDGVWLIQFASLQEPSLVDNHIARTMGLRPPPDRTGRDVLVDHLRDKKVLLILDNCEHLVQRCAEVADLLVRECPKVQLLATSRTVLRIPGESAWRLPSLSVPSPPPPPLEVNRVSEYDAVQLFVERARSVRAEFRVTPENAGAVARICQELDGIPLAIELAATRLRALSVEEVALRLSDRFRLLNRGSRSLPRHQTLQAALEWSYQLLTESERRLFRDISVFVGGFTLRAVESISGHDEIGEDEALDLICALVESSLITAEQTAGETRYQMLETVRLFAFEKLGASGRTAILRDAAARYFVGFGQRVRPHLEIMNEPGWLERVNPETGNIRTAFAWFASTNNVTAGLRLCAAMRRYWEARGDLDEARATLEQFTLLAQNEHGSVDRVDSLNALASVHHVQGRLEACDEAATEAIRISQAIAYQRGVVDGLAMLACAARARRDYPAARAHLQRGLDVSEASGYEQGVAMSLSDLGTIYQLEGHPHLADSCYERASAVNRKLGNRNGDAFVNYHLGRIAFDRGDYGEARLRLSESLAGYHDLGDREGWAYALAVLGLVELASANYDQARAHLRASLNIRRASGDARTSIASLLDDLARVALAEEDEVQACEALTESLTFRKDSNLTDGLAVTLGLCAHAQLLAGNQERAVWLLGAARSVNDCSPPERHSAFVTPTWQASQGAVDSLAEPRQALGTSAVDALYDEGRAATVAEAIAFALDSCASGSVVP
jgi:predicted ATPase